MLAAAISLGLVPSRAADLQPLQTWFARPEAARGAVPVLVHGGLPNAAAVAAASMKIWQAYRAGAVALGLDRELPPFPKTLAEIKALPADQRPEPAPATITNAGKEMPFYFVAKGRRGEHGWPLFIAMHGGGMDPEAVGPHGSKLNDSEWNIQLRFANTIYPDGLYFIPRMADDHDGRWYYSYVQAIYDRVIRDAILFRDVDPNRVYVTGISEGGYAGYRLGAHMADRWAASCAQAAAEPMETSPPENFRNLPFRCEIGESDSLYNRITLARNYFARLDELQQADGDPNAYEHYFDAQKGRSHQINDEPGPLWLPQFTRNPWPTRVVWTVQPMHGVVRRQMYWLALDAVPQQMPLALSAQVADNVVTLNTPASAEVQVRIYLNDGLVNLDRPVRVVANGQTVFAGKVQRRWATLARSLAERGDPYYMFPAEIPVVLPAGPSQ